MSLFEADAASAAVIEALRHGPLSSVELGRRLAGRMDGTEVECVICDLQNLDIVSRDGASATAVFPAPAELPLTSLYLTS